ncbi:oxygen-dependent coproporphyrinogen oxidase [Polluticoccus soli]|uniref:oxygen-dependent coproporphyrinogen oxidase n=1 Tax=Polluticoccus soli TaxID=3034150 RepID=UPI0023E28328|nr:oxygen-dependent coproporphyrinogen oxidase [Flavipsychrobacter sp. JY13-12]
MREAFNSYILELQNRICLALEAEDGSAKFIEDKWDRPEGGGGITRVISNGTVFEKGGVNTSAVHGRLPDAMQEAFKVPDSNFFACGLSLVIHPVNPYVPTIHANWRYFELYDKLGKKIDSWFGGGSDLTPYYIFKEDGRHFHTTLKNAMDGFGEDLYPKYKKHCDEYFINKHRNNEARGIGGVFYDYLRPDKEFTADKLFEFQQANGNAFLEAYLPIVSKRKAIAFTEKETEWQEIRRGRYVEFNLVHDRGTLFGLKTNGRIESILMSLPPRARWYYDYHPEQGTMEAELLQYLQPTDWINI